MDIFEFSIQMEKDAEALYRDLESRSSHVGVKKIFTMLAKDEQRHAEAIETLQKKMHPEKTASSSGEIVTVFKEIKEKSQTEKLTDEILPELRRALDIEKQGREFYKEQMDAVDTEEAKKLFSLLSRQEDYHYNTVENLIELIEKPQWWVEHAEFVPSGDDYY